MKYKPSEVSILVHAGRPTTVSANPDEIGTVTNPLDDATIVPIIALLSDNQGNPIQGKQLHFYDPNGIELDVQTTDVNGLANFNYTVDANHDGQSLSLRYLGD